MAQTVLIAEDEATIRTVVAISLQLEYRVLPVSDADEALSVARAPFWLTLAKQRKETPR
jgi:CheY-like chemotaxis protein